MTSQDGLRVGELKQTSTLGSKFCKRVKRT